MSAIANLISSGECGQQSGLSQLASQVTLAAPSSLQESRSPFSEIHGPQDGFNADQFVHEHELAAPCDNNQVVQFESAFAHEPHHFPFHSGPDLVQQFQNWNIQNMRSQIQNPNVWADQFISGPLAHTEHHGWVDQFHNQTTREAPANAWVEQFSNQSREAIPQQGAPLDLSMLRKLQTSSNEKVRNSKFVQFLSRLEAGEIVLDEASNCVKEIVPLAESKIDTFGSHWASEFDQQQSDRSWGAQFADASSDENTWAQQFTGDMGLTETETTAITEGIEHDDNWIDDFEHFDWKEYANSLHEKRDEVPVISKCPAYVFAEQNPYLHDGNAMEKGIALMKTDSLSEAILAFEAEVQRSRENLNAWRLLGQCNAENENDSQCIAALSTALDLDPYNLDSLLMLGVSHTNDLDQTRALDALKSWLENNPNFQFMSHSAGASVQSDDFSALYGTCGSPGNLTSQVIEMFSKAASFSPNDVNIHTALGVLYNISGDFTMAFESFSKAVQLNPNDASLWNKLGASQANGSQSQLAVHSYRRALELKPNYVRALANLGISFANQGMHREAAQSYLATLSRSPRADHVWSYLNITLASMNCPPEFFSLVDKKDPELFRPYFEF